MNQPLHRRDFHNTQQHYMVCIKQYFNVEQFLEKEEKKTKKLDLLENMIL